MAVSLGLFGAASGKAGGLVFSNNGGKMIVRAYNDNVSNPQTPAQMAQRAKFKLLNQLAAIYAPFIAIKKNGLVTPRNRFVSVNMPLCDYLGDYAVIAPADIQLTDSAIAMSSFQVRREDSKLKFQLSRDMSSAVDGVAYLVMAITGDQEIIPFKSVVTSNAGDAGNYPAELDDPEVDSIVYCYGFRYNTKAGVSNFGSLTVNTADALAKLYATSDLSKAIGSFTETRGFLLASSAQNGEASGSNSVNITATSWDQQNNVTVPGFSVPSQSVVPGTNVTFTAPTITNYTFNGWYDSTRTTQLSNLATYTFEATQSKSICAVYTGPNNEVPPDNG